MKDSFSQNVVLYSENQKEDLLAAPGWPSAALCWIRHHQSDPPTHTDIWLNQKLRIRYVVPHSRNVQAPSFTSESGESPVCLQESCHTTNHCQDSSPRQQNSSFPRSGGVVGCRRNIQSVYLIITIKLITSPSLLLSCLVSVPRILQGISAGTNIHKDVVFRSCLSKIIYDGLSECIAQLQQAVSPSLTSLLKKQDYLLRWSAKSCIIRCRNGCDISVKFRL